MNLYIQHHKSYIGYNKKDGDQYHFSNSFYAESPATGIRYSYNDGQPNIDNPKLAARHFLNAIDRVGTVKDQYQKKVDEAIAAIPMLEKVIARPFEKEAELKDLKTELSLPEKEITAKIKEKQLLETGTTSDTSQTNTVIEIETEGKEKAEAIVVPFEQPDKSMEIIERPAKARGMRF